MQLVKRDPLEALGGLHQVKPIFSFHTVQSSSTVRSLLYEDLSSYIRMLSVVYRQHLHQQRSGTDKRQTGKTPRLAEGTSIIPDMAPSHGTCPGFESRHPKASLCDEFCFGASLWQCMASPSRADLFSCMAKGDASAAAAEYCTAELPCHSASPWAFTLLSGSVEAEQLWRNFQDAHDPCTPAFQALSQSCLACMTVSSHCCC